ncbi:MULTISPECIES: hypothetical protein [Bacteria]|uniref:hypothetical protein n=1 Tax=Bacteria TaxID=2 RepID=UPI0018DCA00C|nr:hypothetical protein [Burkholderia contaminans]MBH9667912.1 hypothetical protein [Burkholderia contaminans]MBH9678737.1 hypothetical protein [Burkholderia contaminans]MBH9705492.1 hypothetical protein [Burkholderia contaminans]
MLENLKALHEAIERGMRVRLPTIKRIEAYPRLGQKIETPLIAIELNEFEPGHDDGTGNVPLIARMQVRVVFDPIDDGAELAVREVAARVAMVVHGNTWELPITPGKVVQVAEDPFRPQLDTYCVWLVEWTHEFGLGIELDEIPDGRAIVWGVDPDTGPGNEAQYWDPAGTGGGES